jgi:transcription elongation factor GreB
MDSPLGRALMKKGLDDEVTVEVPGGLRTLVIVDVSYDSKNE